MAALSSLSFVFPWVLIALATLPLIWWLLRLVPPKPKMIIFPAIQFLYRLKKDEQSAAKMPWWLLLLRLMIAALIILAISAPVLNLPDQGLGKGPLVLIIDDGWTSATHWGDVSDSLNKQVKEAIRAERSLYIVTTAASGEGVKPQLTALSSTEALGVAFSLKPKAWLSDYGQLETLLPSLRALSDPEFVWYSGGLAADDTLPDIAVFIQVLAGLGPLTLYQQDTVLAAPIIGAPKITGEIMKVPLILPSGALPIDGLLSARAATGQILALEPFSFETGQVSQTVSLDIPNSVRNEIDQLRIDDTATPGAVFLLDYRWQRRQIGLIGNDPLQSDQPLLNENHYLTQALSPFFDINRQKLDALINEGPSLIALGDTGNLPSGQEQALSNWIEKGGILIRFAGPKLANADTSLVPVDLRAGNRSLQGAMSWGTPATLGPMPAESPFASLDIPADIKVMKQVLANPSADLSSKTWAQLEDGTPLVTAVPRGSGWLVLFHITATPDWSNLPLSGLFVEMLREIGNMGQLGQQNLSEQRNLPPLLLLDGYGKLTFETGVAEPLNTARLDDLRLNAGHPPGYYGNEDFSIALNIGQFDTEYSVISPSDYPAQIRSFKKEAVTELIAPLLLIALFLVLIDQLVSLHLQGKLSLPRRASSAATVIVILTLALSAAPFDALAQGKNLTDEEKILAATLETRLGYILTNDRDVDAMSYAGLFGLSEKIRFRTSVETREPLAIDIERDPLLFYPLIYWPVTKDFTALSEAAIVKLNDYFNGGGTILFDTRNENAVGGFGSDRFNSPENVRLRQLLSRLDIPRLVPVPADHVVTRSFYLMQSFPGRYAGGDVWIEETSENQGNDGVASLLIGSNDWAAAWAIGADGKPLAATIPGNDRQREMAYRFGINLVMYTLTGNYKADQVHIPAILERLGQ